MKTGLLASEPQVSQRGKTVFLQTRSTIQESGTDEAAPLPVSILGHQYLVDFGSGSSPRYHRVSKNKECSCGAAGCRAIAAVRLYLQAGGARAPDPEGLLPCPICGAKTYRDRTWDGKYTRELGWRCEKGGLGHFLEAKAKRIRQNLAENPWLLPPAPGYPGVRRDELTTGAECQALNRRTFLESDPEETDPTG